MDKNSQQPDISAEQNNKRVFPRINSRCPVVFQLKGSQQWKVGIIDDFSANGVRLRCKEQFEVGDSLSIELKPGSNKTVPAISGMGKIVRRKSLSNGEYEISLKLTQVNAPKSQTD